MRRGWRAIALWSCLAVADGAAARAAAGDCTAGLTRGLDRFTAQVTARYRRCAGRTDAASCRARAGLAVVEAATRASRSVGRACADADLFEAPPRGLGFPRSCAALAAGRPAVAACEHARLTDARSLADCLICWERADLDRLAAWVLPCGGTTATCNDARCRHSTRNERRCLRTIAVAGLRAHVTRTTALGACVRAVEDGRRSGPCPDLRASLEAASALTRARRTVRTCDAVPLAWATCRSGTTSDVTPCGALDSMAGVTDCLDRATTLLASARTCRRFPRAAAHGVPCGEPTTTTTLTTTTTSSTTPTRSTTSSTAAPSTTSSTSTTATTASSTTAPTSTSTSSITTSTTTTASSSSTTSTSITSTTATTSSSPPSSTTTSSTTSPPTTTASTTTTSLTTTSTTATTVTTTTVTTTTDITTTTTTEPSTTSTTDTTTTTAPVTTSTVPDTPCEFPADCDDGDPCTDDRCHRGGCRHEPVEFGDGDHCTNDRCDPVVGVVHEYVDPDDGDPCTIDRCDPTTGLPSHEPIPECLPAPELTLPPELS